ncbi:MAG TPA: YcnI family protein [Iamia sp.]|nr:YcnI family protein [Iamia sp.]
MTTVHRLGLGLLGAGVLALGLAVPAGAHITGDKDSVPAGGFTSVTLTVPHGCEDSPTSKLAVEIPEAILNAAPQVVAGWEAEATETELDEPVDTGEGDPVTERVSEITWTAEAGNELPPHFRQQFTIGFQAPEEVGERLYFKLVQTCSEGETAWIEETEDGAEEPEHPAPFVDVVAAEEDGHGSEAADEPAEETATEPVAADTAGSDSDDGGSSDGLAIGGLVLGALGLAAGGTALLKSRSTD